MPTYKLTYFDARGSAEVIRWVFAAGKTTYEDIRVKREQWPALKPSSPFGQLPMLEVDDLKLCQSHAIARFLAKRFGLAGKNDIEEVQAGMVDECAIDLVKPIMAFSFGDDEEKKAALKTKFVEEEKAGFLEKFEKLLKTNNGGDGYFVGSGVTYADFTVVLAMTWVPDLDLSAYPKLQAHKKRVEEIKEIKEWIENRPKTQF